MGYRNAEKNIPMVESDGVYCLTGMQIRVWSGVKKLSSTVKSTIKPINDDTLCTISASEDSIKSDCKSTIKLPDIYCVVKVESSCHCMNCAQKLLQTSSSKIVRCDRCGYTMCIANGVCCFFPVPARSRNAFWDC